MAPPRDLRALVRHLEIRSRRLLTGPFAGDYRSALRGQGMEFAALRPYEAGDDPRALDPYATARTGTLHLRLYQEERARSLVLLADLSASCNAAKRRLLEETAALLAFAAALHRDRFGLVAFSDRIEATVPPGSGWQHARSLAGSLLACRPQGRGTDLAAPLAAAERLLPRRGMILLLSDGHADLPAAELRRVAARHELAALVLRDADERRPPTAGLALLADAESGERRLVDLTGAGARRRWREAWQAEDRSVLRNLAGVGLDAVLLESGASPLPALRRLFARRRSRP